MSEMDKNYYDKLYQTGGWCREYFKPATKCHYTNLWRIGLNHIIRADPKLIIDLGCGPGQFAELLEEMLPELKLEHYIGLDFSATALEMARKRVSNPKITFVEADLNTFDLQGTIDQFGYDVSEVMFVSYEFMEHINGDLDIVARIPTGMRYSFSVPNYYSTGHVRTFSNKEQIISRYGNLLQVDEDNIDVLPMGGERLCFVCDCQRKASAELSDIINT